MEDQDYINFVDVLLSRMGDATGIEKSRLKRTDEFADAVMQIQQKYSQLGPEYEEIVDDLDFLLVIV